MSRDLLLAYDSACGVCSRFKAAVEFLDARGLLEFLSLGQAEELGALGRIDPSLRYRSFHLIAPGQGVWSGADAVLPLVKLLLPGGSAVSRGLQAVPGCRRFISFGYSTVSRLHGAGACGVAEH